MKGESRKSKVGEGRVEEGRVRGGSRRGRGKGRGGKKRGVRGANYPTIELVFLSVDDSHASNDLFCVFNDFVVVVVTLIC